MKLVSSLITEASQIESGPEWDLNARPQAYHADPLPTELSGPRYAEFLASAYFQPSVRQTANWQVQASLWSRFI